MYKGIKVTKRLMEYVGFAAKRYNKLNIKTDVDLWDVLNAYEIIKEQAECIKYYIYDLIKRENEYSNEYKANNGFDGYVYVQANK